MKKIKQLIRNIRYLMSNDLRKEKLLSKLKQLRADDKIKLLEKESRSRANPCLS